MHSWKTAVIHNFYFLCPRIITIVLVCLLNALFLHVCGSGGSQLEDQFETESVVASSLPLQFVSVQETKGSELETKPEENLEEMEIVQKKGLLKNLASSPKANSRKFIFVFMSPYCVLFIQFHALYLNLFLVCQQSKLLVTRPRWWLTLPSWTRYPFVLTNSKPCWSSLI